MYSKNKHFETIHEIKSIKTKNQCYEKNYFYDYQLAIY